MIVALIVALLVGALVALLSLYAALVTSLFWVILLMGAGWVLANFWVLSWLKRPTEEGSIRRVAYVAWNGFFTYTALLQALVFVVLFFWVFGVLFTEATAPDSFEGFVADFVLGSSALAGLIALGVGLMVSGDGSEPGWRRAAAILYTLAVMGAITTPWIFRDIFDSWSTSHPGLLFWSTLAAYGIMSVFGMYFQVGWQPLRR